MKRNLIYRAGAVLIALTLCGSALTGCGKDDKKDSAPTPAATAASTAESSGKTTVSKFGEDGTEASPTPGASSSANTTTTSNISASALSEARSFFEAGMYDDAQEMLESVDTNELTEDQLKIYRQISDTLSIRSGLMNKKDEFTPEEAIGIVEEAYDVTLDDNTDGLAPQTDANGMQYYTMQVQLDDENQIITINVYSDGVIEELSVQPIAYG